MIAEPVAVSFSAGNGVIIGISSGSFPTAFGAPFAQSGIGVCALVTAAKAKSVKANNRAKCFIDLCSDFCCLPLPQKLICDHAYQDHGAHYGEV